MHPESHPAVTKNPSSQPAAGNAATTLPPELITLINELPKWLDGVGKFMDLTQSGLYYRLNAGELLMTQRLSTQTRRLRRYALALRELGRGLADFGKRADPIEIELLVSEELAEILEETPLTVRGNPSTPDQTMTPEADDRVRVKATVNDTWQLRWWLMAQAEALEVIAPESLRKELEDAAASVLHYYRGGE